MRIYLWFFLSTLISGCAYYGDIHNHSRELDAKTLTTSHQYPQKNVTTAKGWWNKFKDPELNQLIAAAIQDSPSMQIAETRVREATHMADLAYSSLWPSVDMSGYLQRERFPYTGLIPPPFNGKIFNTGDLGLNFNYEFDFWGKNRQAFKARINQQRAEEAELAQSQLVLSAAVAQVYFQLCHDIAQVKIAQEELTLNQKLYQIANSRLRQGVESDIPIQTILTQLEQTRKALSHYQQTETLSRNQLAVLLGKNPFTTDIHTRAFQFHHYKVAIPASLPANLLANRPDISAAKLRAEAAANQVNVAKARFFPDINLVGLFSYQSIELNKLFLAQNQNNMGAIAIDLPIFDAGARRANLRVRYAEFDLAVNQYNQTILTALHEVADQIATLRAVNAELSAQNNAYNAAFRQYNLYSSRYHHGIADYASVLENKHLLLQQQAYRLDLQTRHMQTIVALLKTLGGKDG